MTESDTRIGFLKRASWIGVFGNTVLAALKIVFGILSGSLAVISDGIDTATDIITSLVSLFAAMVMGKPPDRGHPYGHWRAEAIATKLISFVIFFVGAQLALSSGRILVKGGAIDTPTIAAVFVTLASIFGKAVLAVIQFTTGKRHDSPMIIANARNMLGDIYISLGVLIGLVFTRLFDLPIIDSILALAVSFWVMKTAVVVFLDSSVEVMEGIRDHTVYEEIFAAVDDVEGASHPHRTRIRQISTYYVVDLDIEVGATISVAEGHEIAVAVEERIKERVPKVYDIMVHVEPSGNLEENEAYGLSFSDQTD
ncbi:MAG: cation transporter [Spirochaetales bacterium]|jgi:cation diffusion facilitator family transporter|nr:cation transporter [Spirochaetales bacterium]